MRVRTRVLACVAALALSSATPALAEETTSRPGDLVSSEPSAFHPLPGQPTATKAWKIHYRSTSATGAPNVVSGTVIVPQDGRTGPRPLITYAVGTVGLGDSCAPSAGFPKGTTMEANLIQQLTWRGWAVVVTDYEGLGTPGDHTYTAGPSAGHAMLDAARAAIRLPEAGLGTDTPVGIMGYSQGGQASSWAAELHSSYAPELKVKGTATGGVPARLASLAPVHDGSYGSGLLFMAAAGQDAAYPELKLDSYLNQAGKALIGFFRNNCVAVDTVVGSFKRISDLTVKNPLETPEWQARLAESDLGTKAPGHPVYLYHALADELIPYSLGSGLRKDWCAKGADVNWRTIVVGEHISGVITESPRAADWLADRFAGKPASGNC
ncbi:lipase family protein [Streptomyces sp. CB03238]|uniref:lipase family protein n=1 Tax=Streptomyces sp. CB03238 TaxID=1907777 RepID=UPI000A117406|nr:lipase family protein [Streptomyces sp. CB03238]ORT59778.1 lipase [Streptomyces sp. CB03238]